MDLTTRPSVRYSVNGMSKCIYVFHLHATTETAKCRLRAGLDDMRSTDERHLESLLLRRLEWNSPLLPHLSSVGTQS